MANSQATSADSGAAPLFDHVVDLAESLTTFMTLAIAFDLPTLTGVAGSNPNYVLEVPSFKLRGFNLTIGENGVIMASFPVIGTKGVYPGTDGRNTRTSIRAVPRARVGNRFFRKDMTLRMNASTGSALAATDELTGIKSPVMNINFDFTRPLAEDFVVGQDYIIEPDDDGFVEFPMTMEFGRMNIFTANSIRDHMLKGQSYKLDASYKGPAANKIQRRELLFEMPSAQVLMWKAPVSGHAQIKPSAEFKLRAPASGVTIPGMNFAQPVRMTLRNTRVRKLLVPVTT